MEAVVLHLAAVATGEVLHVTEPVGRAGCHQPGLAGCVIGDHGGESGGRVSQRHRDVIARVHEERVRSPIGLWIPRGARVELQRIRRAERLPVLGQVGEVDVLDPAEDLPLAAWIHQRAVDWVFGEAIDIERCAPFGRVAAEAGELGDPSRGIELQLHERDPGGLLRLCRINDVAVAVRRAGWLLLRIGEGVAHRHPKPEGRVKLEIVPLGIRVRTGWLRRDR